MLDTKTISSDGTIWKSMNTYKCARSKVDYAQYAANSLLDYVLITHMILEKTEDYFVINVMSV